ncbi:MAG: PD-(D/E)XK nuclease-like domain-containing protein [Marinospirillum sp.]|uniref:PD-(D/E)XK nuclease-like domain-containing protein n=1 Tax=Marinospirillum sp. TaxID=2183934 RepID=UPI001A07A02B|nr:PD-(D/E)XK nuclease-like domain-containing protein [Marinospirillum sp.]MBE0505874.1 PD-(D/E)XK nuclease-like domain-containing protein [Marinospirillum sp.]
MKSGVYSGISNSDYHGGAGYSKSQLDMVSAAPGLLAWSKAAPQDNSSAAANLGTALHTLLLEPHLFEQQFICEPEKFDRRTTAGKQAAAEFEQQAAGKTILSLDEHNMLLMQRDSVMAHPEARALMTAPDGKAELSAYWEDPDTGLLCRCRPDWWAFPEVIVDVKTTDFPAAFPFAKSVYEYRYHVQDAFYADGCSIASGTRIEEFLFLAIGKRREMGKYPVHVHRLTVRAKDLGRDLYKRDLNAILECESKYGDMDKWPAVESLDLPVYAYTRREY